MAIKQFFWRHQEVINPTVSYLWVGLLSHKNNALWTAVGLNSIDFPDSEAHGANMGPIWGWQDTDGPQVDPMNFAIWVVYIKSVYNSSNT